MPAGAEVAYGWAVQHLPDAEPSKVGCFPPQGGAWGLQSSLIHSGLRYMPLQPTDWLFGIAHDSGLVERMLRIGVRFAMHDEVVWDYYPALFWTDRPAIR